MGADAACPAFSSADWAAMALMGDSDAIVRRVPVGVAVAGVAYPGLAVAVAARAQGGQALAGQDWVHLGGGAPLPAMGGSLRVPPTTDLDWAKRTLRAEDVLAGRISPPKGAVILVGSSLPQRGGLRPTAASPVAPSVQIQADAVRVLIAGAPPYRPAWVAMFEAGFLGLLSLCGVWLMARQRPAVVVGGMAAALALWAAITLGLGRGLGVLIDPMLPGASVALVLLGALTGRAASAARAERILRDRMGQLLPPAVVSRLAAQPKLMRLEGEARDVTALFTDIEGFSLATAHMGAQEMVARLDAYFTVTCAIVLRHGGMIDKLVGDSIHALFNAPLDQPGHETAAIACAAEILAATEAFRARNGGFGRTRIGLEYGSAVLGDVGFGTRIDYTAHGPAVNLAARLQEANKIFGSQICIGPGLAARAKDVGLVSLGTTDIRSHGPMTLYTLKA
jgi:adenylate cyclase